MVGSSFYRGCDAPVCQKPTDFAPQVAFCAVTQALVPLSISMNGWSAEILCCAHPSFARALLHMRGVVGIGVGCLDLLAVFSSSLHFSAHLPSNITEEKALKMQGVWWACFQSPFTPGREQAEPPQTQLGTSSTSCSWGMSGFQEPSWTSRRRPASWPWSSSLGVVGRDGGHLAAAAG